MHRRKIGAVLNRFIDQACNSSCKALAFFRSRASKPSVNRIVHKREQFTRLLRTFKDRPLRANSRTAPKCP